MRTLMSLLFVLVSSSAFAACEPVATGTNERSIYQCDIPAAPNNQPVRCWQINGALLCNGEIGQELVRQTNIVKPVNCGYRKSRYVCW